jgi:hypothetical protein
MPTNIRTPRSTGARLALPGLLLSLGLLACSEAAPPSGSPGTGGASGGSTGGAGGRGGQAAGGQGGAGGASGGSGGASGGSGGASGSGAGGGGGSGGASGGSGGSGGSAAPDAGPSADSPTSESGVEMGPADAAPDLPPATPGPLTAGWTEKTFTFAIHKPYDLPASERYRFDPATGVHTLFVLRTDKAHQPNNTTAPRTEIRIQNDYLSGNHQFEADVMVVAGTDGPSIMQVFGGQIHATAFMLKASSAAGGTVRRYDNEVLKTNVYDKWFHLNVIHEAKPAGIGTVKVYIDGASVGTFDDRDTATHYFKCGVYGPASARAEARFRNIRYWVKP